MSYTPRHEIPRSYVPTPATQGTPLGAQGGAAGGLSPSTGLVTGSGTGLGMYPRVAHPVSSAPSSSGTAAPSPSLLPSGEIPIRVRIKQDLLIAPMAMGPIPQVPPPRSSTRTFDFDFERDFIVQVEKEAAAAVAARASAAGTSGGEAQRSSDAFGGDDSSLAEGSSTGEGRAGGAATSGGASSSSRAMGDAVLSELQQQLEVERSGFAASAMESKAGPNQNGIEEAKQQQQAVALDPAAAEYIAMGYPSSTVHLALAIHSGTSQSKVIDFCSAFGQLSEMGFAPEAIAGALALYDNDRDRALAHLAP